MSRDYRNPRFSYVHTLRDVGSTGVSASSWASNAELWDSQNRVTTASGSTGLATLDFDRGAVTTGNRAARELDRVIVPKGHNLAGNRVAYVRFEETATFGSAAQRTLLDGMTQTFLHPSSYHTVWDFDSSASATLGYYAGMRFQCAPSGNSSTADLGELWWTKREEPTTGIVSAWAEQYVPNDTRIETDSGAAYIVEQGEPRRFFSLEHRQVSGADLLLYEDLLRQTRMGRRPFWYEHPSSGGGTQSVGNTDSTSLWTSGATATLAIAGDYLECTANGVLRAGPVLTAANMPADAPRDWRDSLFSIDVKVTENTSSWAEAAANALWLVVQSKSGQWNTYNLAAPFTGEVVADRNYRMQVDLEADATNTGGTMPADLTSFAEWYIQGDFLNAANQFAIRDPQIISKTSMPHLVEIVGEPRIEQDRSAPKSGPAFTIAFDMLEVIT